MAMDGISAHLSAPLRCTESPSEGLAALHPGFRSPTGSGHSSASGKHKSDPGGTVSVTDQCQIISRGWPRKKYPKQDTFNCLGVSTSGRCFFFILRAAGVPVLSEYCLRNSLSGSPVVVVLRRDFLRLSYFELNYLPLYAQAPAFLRWFPSRQPQ